MVKRRKFGVSPFTSRKVELSAAQERELVAKYQETGDHDIVEQILCSRAKWVQNILNKHWIPNHADMDAVFSDVMVAIFSALGNYNAEKSSLNTYLYRVVLNATIDSVKEQDMCAEQCVPELVLDESVDLSECIENVQRVLATAPIDTMNERARKVAHMLLKGYRVPEIAENLSMPKAAADNVVHSVRCYIAWMMVRDGLSASPIISDTELCDLAMQHERANESCWR